MMDLVSVFLQWDIQTVLIFLAVFLVSLYFVYGGSRKMPPGPFALTLIGNALWFRRLAQDKKRLGRTLHAEWKRLGSRVIRLRTGKRNMIIIHGYDLIHEVFVKQSALYSNRPPYLPPSADSTREGRGIIWQSGHTWKVLRKFALQSLRDFGLGKTSLEQKVFDEVDAATDFLKEKAGKPTDIRALSSMMIANVIYRIVFGKRLTSRLITLSSIQMACSKSQVVAAIDFGTTYTGWAFSFKHDFEADPVKASMKVWVGDPLLSLKGPTCVLIENDGETVHSFGFDAETKYAEIAGDGDQKQWYYFRRFKMMLFGEIGVKKNILLKDASGRKLSALKVFSLVIGFLIKDFYTFSNTRQAGGGIKEDDVHWVLTVPAIWNDAAKLFMREAAINAGIKGDNLTIALEPETASLYCRHLPVENFKGDAKFSLAKFKAGSKYLVLDAGGGTVDITVHEITSAGDVRELHQASGGAWGGTKVDEAFEEFLIELVGQATMRKFKHVYKEDYIDLLRDYEIKKRSITPKYEGKITCKATIALVELYREVTGNTLKDTIASTRYANQISATGDKLRIDAEVMKGFFSEPIQSIVKHVRDLLRVRSVRGCSAIVLVGGLSESPMLQEAIRWSFPQQKVIVPEDAGLAVLKGAVIFGHSRRAIAQSVCKYTRGTDSIHLSSDSCDHLSTRRDYDYNGDLRCNDIFGIHVTVGQTVKLGEEQAEQIYTPVRADQTGMSFEMIASSARNPRLITERGCHEIGKFRKPMLDTTGGKNRKVGAAFIFGETEIELKIKNKTDGRITRKHVDLLG